MPENNHTKQINKALDHIHSRISGRLTTEDLAGQAGMSPYHFLRVFTAATGESPGKYVMRRRMELAAALLSGKDSPPIGEIAERCGFNSTNVFCRNFKKHFGTTTRQYLCSKSPSDSRNRPSDSTGSTFSREYYLYFCSRKTIETGGKTMECTFEIKELPGFDIIYCRHRGPLDQMEGAFTRLVQWAYPRGLVTAPGMKLLSVYHDDPRITAPDKLTADAAMTVGQKIKTDGDIGSYRIFSGRYAIGRFEIGMEDFPSAWEAMFALIDRHGCRCTEGHHYEIYQNNRDEHPQKKWVVDICIPVEPK